MGERQQRFVFPWMGVLSNLPTRLDPETSRRVGSSGSRAREDLSRFNPTRVRPVWDAASGHSGSAVVEFRKSWEGFNDAMAFEGHFASFGRGRGGGGGEGIRGWVAREEDYGAEGPVGEHLRRNGDLKTVGEVEGEEERKKGRLVRDLESRIEEKERCLQEMEVRYHEASAQMEAKMAARDRLHRAYKDGVQKLRRISSEHYWRIFEENQKLRSELEGKQEQLADLAKQSKLKRKTMDKAMDDMKLNNTMTALHMAAMEQKKADENFLKLIEEQKRERESALKRLLQLEKQRDAIQKLQLEIEQLKGTLQVMTHMRSGDSGITANLSKMSEELAEKLEEMEVLENLNQTLIIKEKLSSDELQAAHNQVILGLSEMPAIRNPVIGIKNLGELDIRPFKHACKERLLGMVHEAKAIELHSKWQREIQNSGWHPYKTVFVDGTEKEVVDVDDEKLEALKFDLGEEVHAAVCIALTEMKDNNPFGRSLVAEIWNFRDGRKATLKETIRFILQEWKSTRKKW